MSKQIPQKLNLPAVYVGLHRVLPWADVIPIHCIVYTAIATLQALH